MNTKTDLIGALMVHGESAHKRWMISKTEPKRECILYGEDDDLQEFSLSNKADRMDVVEALGEKHGICIGFWGVWNVWKCEDEEYDCDGDIHVDIKWTLLKWERTHEEAARAALKSLADIYLKEGEG